MNFMKQLKEGVITNNPALVQFIGMCPMLGVSTSLENGIGIGIAVIAVLMCSNAVISLLRNYIPSKVRIAAYIVIIAGFVSMVDMLLKAFLPALSASLGLFIPLIVVNCLILARAESFASKNSIVPSLVDGFSMGLGFTVAISVLGAIRELLGKGTLTIWGELKFEIYEMVSNLGFMTKAGLELQPIKMVVDAPGSFIMLGVLVAVVQAVSNKKEAK